MQVRDRVRGRVSEGLGVDFPFFLDWISLVQADRDGGPGEARWKAFYPNPNPNPNSSPNPCLFGLHEL